VSEIPAGARFAIAPRVRVWIIAPLLISFGLALFGNSLVLRGYAQDGNASGEWGSVECKEFWSWDDVPTDLSDLDDPRFGEYLEKDVAEITLVDFDGSGADDELLIEVEGAYPSYGLVCEIEIEILDGGAGGMEANVAFGPTTNLDNCAEVGNELQCDELTVSIDLEPLEECLAPGASLTGLLVMHVEQAAPQGENVGFTVEVSGAQCDPGDGVTGGEPPGGGPPSELTEEDFAETSGVIEEPRAGQVRAVRTGDGGLLGAGNAVEQTFGVAFVLAGLALLRLPLLALKSRRRD
jgi:hypothetical protein